MGACKTVAFLFAFVALGAQAASFTPGNLVVYRVGVPGGPSLVATGSPVFLDEYALSPSGTAATLVQSIALPTTAAGSNRPLVASGTATTDGLLTRSTDGNCLAVTGYGRDIAITAGNLTSTAGIPRIVAKVTAQATIDTTTALTDAAAAPPTATNFRGAASADCSAFWTAGSAAGIRYAALGATTSADLGAAAFPNIRAVSIFGGQLHASASVANPTLLRNVATVGSGLPVSGPQALVKLPGLADTSTNSPYAFFLADLDPGVPGFDTLYVADDDVGALTKYALVGGSWSAVGTVGAAADAYRGLTGVVTDDGKVILFATRKGGSGTAGGGELVTLTDASGYNGTFTGTPTLLATAATRTALRGVALAPGVVTITPSAGAHGSITPGTPQVVPGATTKTFTVSADAGYSTVMGGTCNGTQVGNTYTTRPATADCTVTATFALVTRTVTPSAGANGTISPSSPQVVPLGATATFDVAAAFGYSASVGGSCGGTLSGTAYTTGPVTADCTVIASFSIITHTVTPSAGANGTISPDSAQTVAHGGTASFTVAAASGYTASVGSTCGGTLSGNTYTTNPVTADCTVAAAFPPLPTYVVTPLAGANGTVTPNAPRSVMSGQTASFIVIPAPGYSFAVRGTCGGSLAGDTYTTYPVARDCSVVFAFAKKVVLFVGNSYTFGRVDPVMSYNSANVTDLTFEMWLANAEGSNADEPHPWGGIPGVFKKLTDQAGLDYDVSISARNAASLRGHYLNSNPAGWDLRGNIASQRWDTVVLQDLSDEPLPANRGANANLPYFNAYVDKIEAWIHGGAAESYTETQLFGGGSDVACRSVTGASLNACNTQRDVAPANTNARAQAEVFLYQTWARPDMIGPNGTNGPTPGTQYYSAAEGLEAMTADFHAAYFGRATANSNIADVSPVGDAFLLAVREGVAMRDPYVPEAGKINLWHTDFFHPSKYGSYLSALVHFATITGLDPMTLGSGEQAAADLGIAPSVAAQLQRIARATVMPDGSAPTTTANASPPANGQGWNQGSVTVTFAAADGPGGWGVGFVTYSLSGAASGTGSVAPGGTVTISAQGETTITYFATDLAGNAEGARTLAIRIDSTAPTLTVPAGFAVDATSPAGAGVSYNVTAADNSGLAPSVACAPASGSTLPIGTSTIACTATDAAGNSAGASFSVSVRGAPEQSARLIAAVLALRGINVSPVVTTLLTTLIQGALNSGNNTLFCVALGAFAKQVTLLSGHGIPAVQAAQLVASANQIRAVLGCH